MRFGRTADETNSAVREAGVTVSNHGGDVF
jgi:hypothetical protein